MSYRKLLPYDRGQFVSKIYAEIANEVISIANDTYNNDSSNTSKEETRRATFLSLLSENKELLENEKEYCKEGYIYDEELKHAMHKSGEPHNCKRCNATRYST